MEITNPICAVCDYAAACNKKIIREGIGPVHIKHQTEYRPDCLCKVQSICVDCQLFAARRCAAWKTLNGKVKSRGAMTSCPKKTPRS